MGASATNTIVKGLQKAYRDTVFLKTGRCLKRAEGPYVEGVVIEVTPYKEHYYVWSFMNTVWATLGLSNLNYSARIAGGRFFVGPADKVVQDIIAELSVDSAALDRVVGPPMTPRRFLETLPSGIPPISRHPELHRTEVIFDCAVAMLLNDESERGLTFIESFLKVARREQHYLRLCARDISKSIIDGNQDYLTLIFDMERQGRFLNRIHVDGK